MGKTKGREGRKRGGRNKGYFFRQGRGWVAGPRMVALTYEDGRKITNQKEPDAVLRAAYARWLVASQQEPVAKTAATTDVTIEQVVDAYLAEAKVNGASQTYTSRADTLFDFCYGFPAQFRTNGKRPTKLDHIHRGFGGLKVTEVIPLHIDEWLQAHPNWRGGRRTKIQAVKRAFNYSVEKGLIAKNPIRGYKVPTVRCRKTYLTDEQEAALIEQAHTRLAMALRVLIRTGARPGIEFAALEARHVHDHGNKMEWVFPPEEAKTKRTRTIRITDPAILEIVRKQVKRYPEGKLFRNFHHEPWRVKTLSRSFNRAMERARSAGVRFDPDTCLYSTRHTYAKRTLQGYWTGRATNIETLARLMGNSVKVCTEHYLNWTETYNEPLWEAC